MNRAALRFSGEDVKANVEEAELGAGLKDGDVGLDLLLDGEDELLVVVPGGVVGATAGSAADPLALERRKKIG